MGKFVTIDELKTYFATGIMPNGQASHRIFLSDGFHYTIIIDDKEQEPIRVTPTSQYDFIGWLKDNVPTATLDNYYIFCDSEADAALIKLFWEEGN